MTTPDKRNRDMQLEFIFLESIEHHKGKQTISSRSSTVGTSVSLAFASFSEGHWMFFIYWLSWRAWLFFSPSSLLSCSSIHSFFSMSGYQIHCSVVSPPIMVPLWPFLLHCSCVWPYRLPLWPFLLHALMCVTLQAVTVTLPTACAHVCDLTGPIWFSAFIMAFLTESVTF